MNRKHLRQTCIGFLLIFLVAACGKQSAPITNPPAVETSLASTARALAQQTQAANPATATPAVTPTATFTPTPKISVSGTSLVFREDQTALFTDHKAGVELVIPAGWMPFRINEQEYYDAFTAEVVLANPVLNDRLIKLQNLDVNIFRLQAFDVREGHIVNGVPTDFNIVFQEGDMRSLEKWAQAETKRKSPYKNFRVVSVSYPKTADETRVLVLEETWSYNETEKVYHRAVFFNLTTGAVVLDFYTNNTFKETVLPDFEQVVNSLTLLNPQ